MSEFKARIIAELDTSKVEQQIKNIDNQKVKITVDGDSAKEAEKNVKSVNTAIKNTAKSTETFGQKLKNALHIGSAAALACKGISFIRQAANDAINSVKELNKSLTNLRIVTNASQTEAEQYISTYSSMAQSLGATTTEVADAATDWLRQGKSISETNQLIQNSMKLSKIGMIDSADATTYLTSALNGYRLEANQATSVVDKLSKLDSSAAVTAGGLAEAMSKTAVSADSAGVTMDRLLGYLATVGSITQENMSTIGNAFKTFFARFTAIKTGKLELIDEDGTTEVLSDVEQSLKNVGIDMRSTITEFDNAGDVLDNLYAKWDSLNGVQQNAIANAFGGVRQKERFLALMENYDKARQYMDLSANSAGAAEQKFGAYLYGIEAKSKSLQAAFESLANNTISSDVIGNIQEATAALITFIDKSNLLDGALTGAFAGGAIKAFMMLKTGITSSVIKLNEFHSALQLVKAGNIGTAEIEQLALMTNNLSNSQLKAVLSSKALSVEQRIAILTTQGLSKAEAEAKISALGLATSEGVAAGATSTLGGTFKGLWATLKANPLLLIVTGITAAVSAFNTYKESVEKAQQATIDTAKEATDHIKELESSLKSYLELDTIATEADKTNALKSVTEQINNKTEALKNATEAEKGYKNAVMDSIEADYQSAAGKAKDAAVAAQEKIAGQWNIDYARNIKISPNETDEDVYNTVKSILGDSISYDIDFTPSGNNIWYSVGQNINTNDIESLLTYYDKLQQAQSAIQQKALELGDSGNALLESPLYKAISEILNNETNKTNIQDYITNRSEEIYNSAIADKGIPETVEQFNNLKNIMLQQAGDSTLLADSITNRLNSAYGSLADEATKAESKVSNLDFTVDTETFTKQLEEQQDQISKIADNYKKISGVIDDYNANGSLSIDNLETLTSVGDEYIGTLFDENGQLKLNKDAYVALAKAKIEDIRYSMLENAISDINQMSKNDEVTATDNLAESTGNLTEETLKLIVAKKIAEGVDKSVIQSRLDTYNQYMAILDNVENGLDNNIDKTLGLSDASNELSKSLSAEQTELENTKESLEEQKAALQNTKDGYDNAIDSIQNLIDWTEKYIKQTKEDEISALEDKKNSIDELVDKQKELLQAEKDEYEWNKEIADKQNAVASNTLSAAVANLDDSSAGKKAAKEANDTLDESRNDIKDSLYKHELEIREQALDELKEKSDEYYDKQINSINEFLNDEVALHKAACNMIDTDSGELYGKLLTYCQTYTTTTEAEFNHMWNSAQSAMQEYNLANVGTWDLLNELQQKSYDVDAAIDDISASIETYESRIDGVKQKIEELADTAKNAADTISAINMTVDDFNGYKYSYNGQTYYYPTTEDSENSKAVASLNILKQMTNKDSKAKELLRQKGWQSTVSTIQGGIKHYAKGTRNSNREVARINEEGQETLFAKTTQGDFALLQPGTQVFTKQQTDVLNDVSSNPDSYLSDFLKKKAEEQANMPLIPTNPLYEYYSLNKDDATQSIGAERRKIIDKTFGDTDKMFSKTINNVPNNVNKQTNITPSIQINVQGDATQSTVKALQNEADKIVKRATENVMNIALRNKNII